MNVPILPNPSESRRFFSAQKGFNEYLLSIVIFINMNMILFL